MSMKSQGARLNRVSCLIGILLEQGDGATRIRFQRTSSLTNIEMQHLHEEGDALLDHALWPATDAPPMLQ